MFKFIVLHPILKWKVGIMKILMLHLKKLSKVNVSLL